MDNARAIRPPLDDETVLGLRTGDSVLIEGVIFGARDAAHARLIQELDDEDTLSIDLKGQIIYYVGPAPARPSHTIGSAGPTTSSRMDRYAPRLYAAGLKATIGKGYRSREVRDAIVEHRGLYLAATGGTGARLSRCIVRSEIVAYPDLGPESIYRFEVVAFPVVVVNDAHGGDLYEQARQRYRVEG